MATGWGPQGRPPTGGGGLARVPKMRVCANTFPTGWHTRQTQRRENRGRHVGTEMTVLTYPCPTASVSVAVRGCARVTGKAGENGQNSGEMRGSSPWTGPSAPGCGDTLEALAGDQRPI